MTKISRRAFVGTTLAISGSLAAQPALARPRRQGHAPAPSGAVPSARQWRWHGREAYAFIHFNMNTFTDREWGYGDEDPKLFNPTDFSADQIVAAVMAGGLKGLILTAKHHDGFCLWPTPLTEHCIRNSPYKNGKGDIVREMSDACRRAGLPFGIYLSPWDRNHADYGRPAYIDYYRAQLTNLCTHYGALFEVWFDGANGGDGYYGGARETRHIDAPRYYDWPSIIALVHRMQPGACTFDPLGADLRWVGNEKGVAGDPCWPTMPNQPYEQSLGNSGLRGGTLWWPAETDVSIRPGWFYHPDENAQVKSPNDLVHLYDVSVGRGTNLNLNVPPDRRGRIADHDVAVLKSFGGAIRASFARDLARTAIAHASASRGAGFEPHRVLDGDRDTYWSTPDAALTPSLTLDLAPGTRFDLVRLREYLPLGVRVTRFALDVESDGAWQRIAERECISAQRLIRLPQPIAPRRLRFTVLEGSACPAISEIGLFLAVAPAAVAAISVAESGAIDARGWTVAAASAPGADRAIDGNPGTAWMPPAPAPGHLVSLTLAFPAQIPLGGFSLTPSREPIDDASPPSGYHAWTSLDGKVWEEAASGEFANIAYALATQRIMFDQSRPARFLRLEFAAAAVPARQLAIAEIGGIAAPATDH